MNEIRPGAKLKMLIQNAGYTLKEFAPMVGMSRETLHRKLNSAILDQSLVTKAAKVLQLEEIEIMDDMIREVREPQAA
jgi:transcriptional regulator with XRE-family HTH domain